MQRLAEIVVDRVATGVFRIVLSTSRKRSIAPGYHFCAVVVVADLIIGLAQAVPRLAQPAFWTSGISLLFGYRSTKVVELLDRLARLGLIALRRPHLPECAMASLYCA